jgi:hypothetical protein
VVFALKSLKMLQVRSRALRLRQELGRVHLIAGEQRKLKYSPGTKARYHRIRTDHS